MRASVRNLLAWFLQALLALVFIKSGFDKLHLGAETVRMFTGLGLPGWFAYFIGGAELLGGIGLLVPRLVRLAALGLAGIMVGALVMHATTIAGGLANGRPAMIMLGLLGLLLLLRRPAARRA